MIYIFIMYTYRYIYIFYFWLEAGEQEFSDKEPFDGISCNSRNKIKNFQNI